MSTIYRPTLRMDDRFRQYVDQCHKVTRNEIDRNKLLRLMLFAAPFSALYHDRLRSLLLPDRDAPLPCWHPGEEALWMEQQAEERGGASIGTIKVGDFQTVV